MIFDLNSYNQIAPARSVNRGFCDPDKDCDLGETIGKILDKNDPMIISFGELNMPCNGNSLPYARSTLEIFADSVIPLLKKHNIHDLVVEYILGGPRIEAELDYFHQPDGKIDEERTPYLYKLSKICTFQGIDTLLTQSKSAGIRVHPGGPTYEELHQPDLVAEDLSGGPHLKQLKLIRKKLEDKIRELVEAGKKTASYGGALHNDIVRGAVPGNSFGWKFRQEYGDRYVEVDLVLRNNLQDISARPSKSLTSYPDYKNFVRYSDPYNNICRQKPGLPSYLIAIQDQIDYAAEAYGEKLLGNAFPFVSGPVRTTFIRPR